MVFRHFYAWNTCYRFASFSKKSHSVILSQLYTYEDKVEIIRDSRFYGRLKWRGSNDTTDLQDGSILIDTVTFNDTGTYKCIFNRTLIYTTHRYEIDANRTIVLNVVPQGKDRGEGCCTVLFEQGRGKLN